MLYPFWVWLTAATTCFFARTKWTPKCGSSFHEEPNPIYNIHYGLLYKPPKIAPYPITLFSKSLTNSWPKKSPIAFKTWESSKRKWAPRKWSPGSQKSKKLWWWNHGLQWRKILENWVSNSSWSKPKLNLFYFHLNLMSYCFISIAVWTYGNSRKVLDWIFL